MPVHRRIRDTLKAPVRAAVRLALRPGPIRRLVRQELAGPRVPPRTPTGPSGSFTDRHGVEHRLDPALRDRLKPGWQQMVDPVAASQPPSDRVLADRAAKAAVLVREADALVASLTGAPLTGRILEIGCYDGAVAFQLAARPGTEVVASDLARYYVVQRPGEAVATDLAEQQALLADIRERARAVAGGAAGAVRFVEDDITESGLEPGRFDAIVSFEVLEHLAGPDAAFAAMARLLRPGGVGYHDYNPFFSAKGGHSLCTLDFPWGHARLDRDDLARYLRELRPSEADQAMRFFTESLNRMTMADLRASVAAAGLELLAIVPWSERSLLDGSTADALTDVRRLYPTATVEDLLATLVAVVVRRPATDA
jgi:SAM-dependent methyltransferase